MVARALHRRGDVLLGRFKLVKELATGLGGQTWLARQTDGGPDVAVKILPPVDDGRATRDLLHEAVFLRELDHPHVVRYLGVVDLPGGGAFLVTEFVHGGDLADWIAVRGPCPPTRAIGLLLQIVEGLLAVHARGILHRDLKPRNVLVDGHDPVRLLVADFGVSRRAQTGEASVTRVAGTPGYAAPEVWAGRTLTPAVDVYGLGAIGWCLLTGADPEPPLGAAGLEVRDLALWLDPSVREEADDLLELLGEMLSASPAARPSLAAVAKSLTAMLDARGATADASDAGEDEAAWSTAGPTGGRRRVPTPTVVPATWAPDEADLPAGETEDPTEAAGAPAAREVRSVEPPSLGQSADAPGPRRGPWSRRLGLLAVLAALALLGGGLGLVARDVPWASALPPVDASRTPPSAQGRGAENTVAVAVVDAPPVASLPPARRTPAVPAGEEAPADPTPRAAAPATEEAPSAAPTEPAVKAEAPPPDGTAAPPGAIGRLRVGVDAPGGLPADAAVIVTGPDGAWREASSTQLVLHETHAGSVSVAVRSSTRILGETTVDVPDGAEVRVLCTSPAADFAGLSCVVRP